MGGLFRGLGVLCICVGVGEVVLSAVSNGSLASGGGPLFLVGVFLYTCGVVVGRKDKGTEQQESGGAGGLILGLLILGALAFAFMRWKGRPQTFLPSQPVPAPQGDAPTPTPPPSIASEPPQPTAPPAKTDPSPAELARQEEERRRKTEEQGREDEANRLLNFAKSFEEKIPDEAVKKYDELRTKYPESSAWKEGAARYQALVERRGR